MPRPMLQISAPTPASIASGVQLILDPANVLVTSGNVETFYGRTNAIVTQSDSTRRAQYIASDSQFNNLPVARFFCTTASDFKYYDLPSMVGYTEGEVFMVYASTFDVGQGVAPGTYDQGIWRLSQPPEGRSLYTYTNYNYYDSVGISNRFNFSLSGKGVNLMLPHVLSVSYKKGAYKTYINNVLLNTVTTGFTVSPIASPRIGGDNPGAVAGMSGRVAYFISCNAVQTDPVRGAIIGWLRNRFNF